MLVSLCEIEVADHDRRLVAQSRRHGWPPAPGCGAVDDVVVDEGGRVREFDRHGGGLQPIELVAAAHRGEKDECRADSLAAGLEQIRHRARNLRRIAVDFL